ncbi:uncharacterized protein VNE69_03084 [Vairimorpha necatrix]|uniref:Phycobilisome protein n=1 Tax=Vairimorpha necatrix TaxID=6039 RepID=A0AAX4JAI1_9MICR
MPKKEILLSKLNSLKSKFDTEEQKILVKFFIDESIKNIFNEKSVDKNKLELFHILQDFDLQIFNSKKEDLMRHKAIQTRALVLDLITSDYSKDVKYIYKPEKWIFRIIEDIKNSLINYKEFVFLYNKLLIKEFEDIFINKVEKYGSSGNQLLVNFIFYKKFILKYLEYDFSEFLIKIKNQIDSRKVYPDSEIDDIVNESINKM